MPTQGGERLGVLVEAGGEPDGVGESKAPSLYREARVFGAGLEWGDAGGEKGDADVVGRLGVHQA